MLSWLPSRCSRGCLAARLTCHRPATVLGLLYLLVLVASPYRARRFFARRAVRRSLDGVTGLALVGFSARLAAEQA